MLLYSKGQQMSLGTGCETVVTFYIPYVHRQRIVASETAYYYTLLTTLQDTLKNFISLRLVAR